MIRVLLISIMVGFIIASCSEEPNSTIPIKRNEIHYVKDSRTDVCFATYDAPYRYGLSVVDCDKVKAYLE